MPNVLITTIVRNEARYLDRWADQIRQIIASQPGHRFGLSVFENDSTDGSPQMLAGYYWGDLPRTITTARLNSPYFIGGKARLRTQLLADARNRAIYGFPMLAQMDTVLVVEPDVAYSMDVVDHLLNQEKHYGRRFDVLSGKSVHPGTDRLYDSWGTRKKPEHDDWAQCDGVQDGGLEEIWSTFNCLVALNAKPIKDRHTFSGINPRTGQPDCDTVAIVEAFRLAGYGQVAWDRSLHVAHSIDT